MTLVKPDAYTVGYLAGRHTEHARFAGREGEAGQLTDIVGAIGTDDDRRWHRVHGDHGR